MDNTVDTDVAVDIVVCKCMCENYMNNRMIAWTFITANFIPGENTIHTGLCLSIMFHLYNHN